MERTAREIKKVMNSKENWINNGLINVNINKAIILCLNILARKTIN